MTKKKQARLAREAALAAAQASSYKIGTGTLFPSEVGCRWPVDISELADRIAKEGNYAVPDKDRDLVARMLPRGILTPRDGLSIAPKMRDAD